MRGYLQECVWLQSGLLIISRFSPQHWWLLSPSCIGRAHHLDNFPWTVYSSPSQDLETTWRGQDSTWLERRQSRLARISGKVLPPLLLCININRLDLESLLKNSHKCTYDKDAGCYVQGTAFSGTYRSKCHCCDTFLPGFDLLQSSPCIQFFIHLWFCRCPVALNILSLKHIFLCKLTYTHTHHQKISLILCSFIVASEFFIILSILFTPITDNNISEGSYQIHELIWDWLTYSFWVFY